jgi:hypothetical protein
MGKKYGLFLTRREGNKTIAGTMVGKRGRQ